MNVFNKLLILRTPKIGPARYRALVEKFGSVEAAAQSLRSDVAHVDMVRREMDLASKLGFIIYPMKTHCIQNHYRRLKIIRR